MFSLHICTQCACSTHGGKKRAVDPWNWSYWLLRAAENLTYTSWNCRRCSYLWTTSLVPPSVVDILNSEFWKALNYIIWQLLLLKPAISARKTWQNHDVYRYDRAKGKVVLYNSGHTHDIKPGIWTFIVEGDSADQFISYAQFHSMKSVIGWSYKQRSQEVQLKSISSQNYLSLFIPHVLSYN